MLIFIIPVQAAFAETPSNVTTSGLQEVEESVQTPPGQEDASGDKTVSNESISSGAILQDNEFDHVGDVLDAPLAINFSTNHATGGIEIEVDVPDPQGKILKVEIPTWNSDIGGQDDLIWHSANRVPGTNTWKVTTSTTEHKGQSGIYVAHVYVTEGNGAPTFFTSVSGQVTHPPQAMIQAGSLSADGKSIWVTAFGGALGTATKVQFPTWSADGGQDDLIWYNATKAGGVWQVTIPLSTHKSTGTFLSHVYAGNSFLGATSFVVDKPTLNTVTLTDKGDGKFEVSVDGILKGTNAPAIAKVEIAVWNSAVGGQDDLVWYPVTLSGGTGTISTSTMNHKGQSGVYQAHVYATDANGASTFVGAGSLSIKHPALTISTPAFSPDKKSVTIFAYGGALGSATQVRFPTWSTDGGQDDLVWYNATKVGGVWQVTIPLSTHKSTGTFLSHVYAGNSFVGTTSFFVDLPKIEGSVTFDSYVSTTGKFTITAKVKAGSAPITGVQIPTWGNAGGQNDLVWHQATQTSTSGDVQTWSVDTSVPQHMFENTSYISHVYVTDANGASTFVGMGTSSTYSYTGPAVITAVPNASGTEVVISAGGGSFSSASTVSFPVWSVNGGQDDIRWYQAQKYGNSWTARIPLSNHRSTGTFNVHAYGTLSGVNSFISSTSFAVAPPRLAIASGLRFVDVNSNTNTGYFAVHVPVQAGAAPVTQVRIAVWSEANGQNDLRWLDAHVVAGNEWGAADNVRNHRLETGTYIAHVYVTDANGASTFIGAVSQTGIQYTGPTFWETFIDVNLSTQYMVYYVDGVAVLSTDVVTGLPPSRSTPTGTFRVLNKARKVWFDGGLFSEYWLGFTYQGHGFHDANWQSSFGGSRYLWAGSHGCVNMPYNQAAYLWEICPVGTEVRIHF